MPVLWYTLSFWNKSLHTIRKERKQRRLGGSVMSRQGGLEVCIMLNLFPVVLIKTFSILCCSVVDIVIWNKKSLVHCVGHTRVAIWMDISLSMYTFPSVCVLWHIHPVPPYDLCKCLTNSTSLCFPPSVSWLSHAGYYMWTLTILKTLQASYMKVLPSTKTIGSSTLGLDKKRSFWRYLLNALTEWIVPLP